VEGEVPAVAEAQHLEHAALGEIAADLLGHAHADMLDDLLGAADMRRDLGDRLEDEMQIADRDALGEQQLQHGLQADRTYAPVQISSAACGIPGPSRSSSAFMSL
jgi:hypothetical protein